MTFEMIIAVTVSNKAVIILTPDECIGRFTGDHCEDNNFVNTPTQPGVYRCQIERKSVFVAGGENFWRDSYDEEFHVVSVQPIMLKETHPA